MSQLDLLMDDAHRRACIQKNREGVVDLRTLWAGLGYPSQFKGRARVYFAPIGEEIPRVLNWYRFTHAGRAEYLRRYATAPDYFHRKE